MYCKIITSIIVCLFGIVFLFLTRKNTLHAQASVWWLGIVVFIGISSVVFVPFYERNWFLEGNALLLTLLSVAVCYLLLRLFLIDIGRAKEKIKFRRMVQQLALMEQRLPFDKKQSQTFGE